MLLRQEVDPVQADLIRTAVEEIMRGVPANWVITRLNREEVPTAKKPPSDHSRRWMNATLRQIIKNPTIAGLRVSRDEIIEEADWPAILPVKQWEEVNQMLADSAGRVCYVEENNHGHIQCLPSHIANCDYCGRPLVRFLGVVPRKDDSVRNNYACRHTDCRKISTNVERPDASIIAALIAWLSTSENLAILSHPDERWLDRVKEAQILAAEPRERRGDATTEYAEGRISLSMRANDEQRLTPQIEQASRAAVPPVIDKNLAALLQLDDIETARNGLDLVEQRWLMKILLDFRNKEATQRGGKFHTDRIKIVPRFVPVETYR